MSVIHMNHTLSIQNWGYKRPSLCVSSANLAKWLGLSHSYVAQEIYALTWWWDKGTWRKRTRDCQKMGYALLVGADSNTYISQDRYLIGHAFALRICKKLDQSAVTKLQAAFAEYRRRMVLPGLEADTDYSHQHIHYTIRNAAYHNAGRVLDAFWYELESDADRYADSFVTPAPDGRRMAVQMGRNGALDIRVFDARSLADHKEAAFFLAKRLIRRAMSEYKSGRGVDSAAAFQGV